MLQKFGEQKICIEFIHLLPMCRSIEFIAFYELLNYYSLCFFLYKKCVTIFYNTQVFYTSLSVL